MDDTTGHYVALETASTSANGTSATKTRHYHFTIHIAKNLSSIANRTILGAREATAVSSRAAVVLLLPLTVDFWSLLDPRDVLAFLPIRRSDRKSGDAEYWNSITLVPTFSVPSMWTDKARGQLRCAAVRVGVDDVDTQDEALSVAATDMKKLVDFRLIEKGQIIVAIEGGQGTYAIATAELVRKASSESAMRIQPAGLTDGSEAGAGELNRLACESVRTCDEFKAQGGLQA